MTSSAYSERAETLLLKNMVGHEDFGLLTASGTTSDAAYAANDVFGGLKSIALPQNGLILNTVTVTINEAVSAAGSLWFFREAPTSIADNAAFAPTIADLNKVIGIVMLGAFAAVNSLEYSFTDSLNIVLRCASEKTPVLYFYHVLSGAPDFAAGSLIQWRLNVL